MTRQIRILHVIHTFTEGGMENGVVNIINNSPDHLVHELCVLAREGDFMSRFERPVVVHRMKKRDGNDFRMILQLRDLFRSRNIDIIHTRNWAAFDGVVAACLTAKPVLIHGEHGRAMSDARGLVYRHNLIRRMLAFRARKFVAVSRDLYKWLKEIVHIPASKLALIPNGVDTQRFFTGRDTQLRAELGIGEDEFVVGTIGRFDRIKNHEGLIDAVKLHNNEHSGKVRLVIVGDGPERTNVENHTRIASLSPEPLLLGYRRDVERFYRMFDVFVLNSFGEGMSNTLLEAMASRLPIICTDVGDNAELIADGRRGIVIEPGNTSALADAIAQYVRCPDRSLSYADSAHRFAAENFSLQQMVNQYVAMYESVA